MFRDLCIQYKYLILYFIKRKVGLTQHSDKAMVLITDVFLVPVVS